MKLEEIIAQRLAAATAEINEGTCDVKPSDKKEKKTEVSSEDEVVINPKTATEKKEIKSVSEEDTSTLSLATLLEQAGLEGDFALKATTIFDAAVNERVISIEEKMKQEFDAQLAEAVAEIENDIDGFVTESVAQWQKDNEVAIKQSFKSQMNESLIDGLTALLKEHAVDISEEKVDALDAALSEVAQLEEALDAEKSSIAKLQEQVATLKAQTILESFKSKMTQTEFDRFTQLTSNVQFTNEDQYQKQLNIVHETFTAFKQPTTKSVVTESVNDTNTKPIITESNSNVNVYAKYISNKKI